MRGIQQLKAIEVGGRKRLCWRETSWRINQLKTARGYSSMGRDKAVLERDHSGDTAAEGYRSRGGL